MREVVHLLAPSEVTAIRWALNQGWLYDNAVRWDVLVPLNRGLERLRGFDRPVVVDLYDVCERRGGPVESAELQEIYARLDFTGACLISGADEQVRWRVARALQLGHPSRVRAIGELRLNLQRQWVGVPDQQVETSWPARWTVEPVPGMSIDGRPLEERIDDEIEDWQREVAAYERNWEANAMHWSPEPEEEEQETAVESPVATLPNTEPGPMIGLWGSGSAVLTWLPGGDGDGDEVVFQGYLADGVFYQT